MMKGYGEIVDIIVPFTVTDYCYVLDCYVSGDAKVLGGRAKRSTYFCQTKGNDERNGEKPQGKLSALRFYLTKSLQQKLCIQRTTQLRRNLLGLIVARAFAQAIHILI